MNQTGFDSSLPMMARGGLRWRLHVEAASAALAGLPAERSHELRYEHLMAEPQKTVGAIFAFLGLTYDSSLVPDIHERTHEPWRQWSEADREAFKRVAGALLHRLGYDADDDW